MQKAIIIGASSGIGRALAKQMSEQGYALGITGRRTELLESLQQELSQQEPPQTSFIATMDVEQPLEAVQTFKNLLDTMGDVELVILNAGIGFPNLRCPLQEELETVAINVTGFTAIANAAYHYFAQRNGGHIVGISSVAAVRGGPVSAYHASKAYVSSYLEGLRCRAYVRGKNISVTDIRPGFVETALGQGKNVFWRASVDTAAQQILQAIHKRQAIAYVTRRWRLIAILMSLMPHRLYRRTFQ